MKKFLKSKNKKFISLVFSILVISLIPLLSQAVELIPQGCTEGGECGVCEIIQTAVNFSQILLGLTGGIALIMFIWAGFGLVISAGNPEKIAAKKKIITGTIIGIIIILLAWEAVNASVLLLTGQQEKVGKIITESGSAGQIWAEFCKKK